jgi:hypothetical protein
MGHKVARAQAEPATDCSVSTRCEAENLAREDLQCPRAEYLFKLPSAVVRPLLSLLVDARDEPILHLLCNQLLLVIPAVVLLFSFARSHWWGVLYIALNYALFLQRYMLTLHFTEHRQLFRRGESSRPPPHLGAGAGNVLHRIPQEMGGAFLA